MQLTSTASAVPVAVVAESGAGLPRGVGGAGREPIEIAAHQLRDPAFRHVAGEGHRARLAIDRQDGAHHV